MVTRVSVRHAERRSVVPTPGAGLPPTGPLRTLIQPEFRLQTGCPTALRLVLDAQPRGWTVDDRPIVYGGHSQHAVLLAEGIRRIVVEELFETFARHFEFHSARLA